MFSCFVFFLFCSLLIRPTQLWLILRNSFIFSIWHKHIQGVKLVNLDRRTEKHQLAMSFPFLFSHFTKEETVTWWGYPPPPFSLREQVVVCGTRIQLLAPSACLLLCVTHHIKRILLFSLLSYILQTFRLWKEYFTPGEKLSWHQEKRFLFL